MTEIAKEYATALFMLACEENAKKEFANGLQTLKNAFVSEPEYLEFLSSPSVPLGERLTAVNNAFFEKVPEHILSFLLLLCEKGRISCFLEAVEEFNNLLQASERISKAKVTSAVEMSDQEKQKLKIKLESTLNCDVIIEYFVDETILGGLIVEVDGKIMDGSLRQRLREVREVMNT